MTDFLLSSASRSFGYVFLFTHIFTSKWHRTETHTHTLTRRHEDKWPLKKRETSDVKENVWECVCIFCLQSLDFLFIRDFRFFDIHMYERRKVCNISQLIFSLQLPFFSVLCVLFFLAYSAHITWAVLRSEMKKY